LRVESALLDQVGVDSGGGERAVFEPTAEDHDGIGVGHRIVDDPGPGDSAQERSTENKAESRKQKAEKDEPEETAKPAADGGTTDVSG
jgi:hypothetical protein